MDGLYLVLISLHGLVRGERMELGKDPDTGGQVRGACSGTLAQQRTCHERAGAQRGDSWLDPNLRVGLPARACSAPSVSSLQGYSTVACSCAAKYPHMYPCAVQLLKSHSAPSAALLPLTWQDLCGERSQGRLEGRASSSTPGLLSDQRLSSCKNVPCCPGNPTCQVRGGACALARATPSRATRG